jgi:hypothetical protein
MDVSRRQLTEEEHAKLQRLIAAESPARIDDWVVGVLAPFALLFVPLLLVRVWLPGLAAFEVPFLLLLLPAGAYLAIRLRRRRERQDGTGLLRADLRGNEVEVARYDVERAERIEPTGSRPPGYFLEVGGGRTLFLEGDYLKAPIAAGEFPSRHLETVRTPLARRVLGLRCSGGTLSPAEVHPPFSEEEREEGDVPLDGDLLLPETDEG